MINSDYSQNKTVSENIIIIHNYNGVEVARGGYKPSREAAR